MPSWTEAERTWSETRFGKEKLIQNPRGWNHCHYDNQGIGDELGVTICVASAEKAMRSRDQAAGRNVADCVELQGERYETPFLIKLLYSIPEFRNMRVMTSHDD